MAIWGAAKARLVLLAFISAIASVFIADTSALAQSANCQQLASTLNTLTRNGDFRTLEQNADRARTLREQIQGGESEFVRGGCQQLVNSGQRLSPQCRNLANLILSGRETYNELASRIETGQAVAQQREVTLQQIARFGCGTGNSTATYEDQVRQQRSPFQGLLDRLFGGQQIIDDFEYGYFDRSTLRTVCVRACDGYYWPVSFSTISEFLQDDAAQCASQCPGADVDLYYYQNPGEDADDMINMSGVPYTALPNAFRYREEFDASCSCKAPTNYGSITLASTGDTSSGRAMIAFNELSFPLPMRDPRRQNEVSVVAAVHVPLPRKRPVREGEPGAELAQASPSPAVDQATAERLRLISSGQRMVRVVGPDTPYAQSAASGS